LPPAGFCATPDRRRAVAFGIAIVRTAENIYVRTNCGLAISNNSGLTWRFTDPTPIDGADNVWDAVVHDGGTIDLCGDDGHLRSTDGGATWQTATSSPLPGGRCAIAASPEESYVLFAVVGTTIYESDDGGGSWPVTYATPALRAEFPSSLPTTDLESASTCGSATCRLHRADCNTPSSPHPVEAPAVELQRRGPDRSLVPAVSRRLGDIAFDSEAATTARPMLFRRTAESTSTR
jgi:hypothetical protein